METPRRMSAASHTVVRYDRKEDRIDELLEERLRKAS
jgi:hypothetical protein